MEIETEDGPLSTAATAAAEADDDGTKLDINARS